MNFKRQYNIIFGVPGQTGTEISSIGQERPLHVSFDLEKADTESSNTGKLQISNLSDEHKAALSEEGCVVEIKAGYNDTCGTIFLGGVANPSETLSNADRTLEVELVDGLSNYDSVGTISINGIVTGDVILEEIRNQMGIESAIITDKAAELLSTAKYANGYCFVGKLKAALQSLMDKAGLTYTLQNGVLQVFYQGEAISVQAYKISSETGLISIPKKITITESSTSSGSGDSESNGIPGYEIEYFINGAIGINDLIQVESKEINGIFRVKNQSYKGDNYGNDWKCVAQIVEVTA
jgi:hypothetical protein